jgi:cytochrome c peroxidase
MLGPGAIAVTAFSLNETVSAKQKPKDEVDLSKVREAIMEVIDNDQEKRGDGTSLSGTMIRLAWHSSGTYSAADHTGGSDGARMVRNKKATDRFWHCLLAG